MELLRNNAEFRLLFADHVQKHFFNGGALTPENAAARWMKWACAVEPGMIADVVAIVGTTDVVMGDCDR